MKVIPVLRAPATGRSAFLFSFILCLILPALLAGQGAAQTSIPGYTPPAAKLKPELSQEEKARRGAAPLSRIHPQIKIESARIHKLSALASSEMRPERKSMRLRIGAVRQLDRPLAPQNDGTIFQAPEGKIYLMRVVTEGAAMTRLHFSRVALPAGGRLFVYSRDNPDEYYPLHIPGDDGLNVTGLSEFWTPPLTGEEVVVEYLAPTKGLDEPGAQPFGVDQVSHIFFDPRASRSAAAARQNGAAACNLNVPAEWSEGAKSVGMLQFSTPKGEFACSGVLLNTSRSDNQPFFLTANHCLSESRFTQSVTVYWLYTSGDRPGGETPRTNGATVIATGVAGDFSLMQLNHIPPGVRRAGWSAEPIAGGTPVASIHHPQASYQRFAGGQTIDGSCPSDLPGVCEHFAPVRWQQGITEPGSSGAPLFAGPPEDPRVVGALSGGLSACDNRQGADYFGRFELAFPAIAPYLTGQGCAFFLQSATPNTLSHDAKTREIFSAAGGDGKINLRGKGFSHCAWTARSEAEWITLTSAPEGTGEAVITYTVAPHAGGGPRHGYLSIAGHRLLVSQMGVSNCGALGAGIGQTLDGALTQNDCRSALEPQSYIDRYTFDAQTGQQFSIVVNSSVFDTFVLLYGPDGKVIDFNDDANYSSNATLPADGLRIEATADGAHTIEVTSYDPGATGAYRVVINRHCYPRLTPDPLPPLPPAGGPGAFNLVSPFGCPWTAQSDSAWLTITEGQGNGNGLINYTAMPYSAEPNSMPREGRIRVNIGGNSFSFTIKQQPICNYSVFPKSLTIKASEAVNDSPHWQVFGVTTGPSCEWTATSNMLGVEFPGHGASYTAAGARYVYLQATRLKFGNAPSSGTLTLAGETVTVAVEPLGALCPTGNLAVGQTVGDSLAPNCRSITGVTGYVKQYRFQGRAGQRIAVVVSSLEVGASLWLKRMDGDEGIFAARLTPQLNFQSPDPGTLRMPETGYITLPADGAYFLEVSSYTSPARAGSFILSVIEAPNSSCDFTISTDRHNLAPAGGRGSVSITATGGNCAQTAAWTATSTAPWIKLMAAGGNGSGALEYSVEPNTGAFRAGAISLAGRHLLISQQPANAPVVVSAADYAPNLATGAIQAVFGVGLATQTVAATTQPLPTTLGGTQVVVTTDAGESFDAPLFFVSPDQINFQTPRITPSGVVNITVKVNGQTAGSTRAALGYFAPALFTADTSGRGAPAAYALRVLRDGTQTPEPIFDRDAAGRITPRAIRMADNEDVYLILYGTGFNSVALIGYEVEATFQPDIMQKGIVAVAPGFAGLDQVNLLLPPSLRGRGDVTLTIKRNGVVSNPVTIKISE